MKRIKEEEGGHMPCLECRYVTVEWLTLLTVNCYN